MTRAFKIWIGSLALVALFTIISVEWFDRPVASLVHALFGRADVSAKMAASPGLSVPLISTLVFAIYGLLAIMGRQFSRAETTLLLCDISLLVDDVVKNQLKFVFGRTWPDSWEPGVVSFVRDNAFGFHFFQTGKSYESFPSGHAAAVAAAVMVVWMIYPRARLACAGLITAADIGLVLLNVHFISDVVAGTFLGCSVALFVLTLWGQPLPPSTTRRT